MLPLDYTVLLVICACDHSVLWITFAPNWIVDIHAFTYLANWIVVARLDVRYFVIQCARSYFALFWIFVFRR